MTDIQSFIESAGERGVHLELEWLQRDKELQILWIDGYNAERGAAADVLRELQCSADEHGFKLVGVVFEGEPKLVEYYKGLGFEVSDGSQEGGDEPMIDYNPKIKR